MEGRVQGGEGEGLPETPDEPLWLAFVVQPVGQRGIRSELPVPPLESADQPRGGPFFAPGQAACGGQTHCQMQGGREPGQTQVEVRAEQTQGAAIEGLTRTKEVDQAQGLGVGAQHQMRAVVDFQTLPAHGAGATTQQGCGLEQRDWAAGQGELDGGGDTGPAPADDGDALLAHWAIIGPGSLG